MTTFVAVDCVIVLWMVDFQRLAVIRQVICSGCAGVQVSDRQPVIWTGTFIFPVPSPKARDNRLVRFSDDR